MQSSHHVPVFLQSTAVHRFNELVGSLAQRALGRRNALEAAGEIGQPSLDLCLLGATFNRTHLVLHPGGLLFRGQESIKLGLDQPVLLATGHLDPECAAVLEQDPRALALAKPFTLEELGDRLRDLAALPPLAGA